MANVMVCLSGRKINQDTYIKGYMYSIINQKLIEPKMTDKKDDGNSWEDVYYLVPGTYLIIEVNLDNSKHNCVCKRLNVFTKEDYISDKKERMPNADIEAFRALYHYGGWEIGEWEGFIPDWVELPCKCLYHWKRIYDVFPDFEEESEEDRQKRISYKQPKEVEDKLALLLEDEQTKTSALLIKKIRK